MNHIYKEVKIPVSWGTLAGKLWMPQCSHTTKHTGVLMIHGHLDNAASFDSLIKYFPQEMTLLALDLPGHGFSDHYTVKNSYQYFSFITAIIEVLKYLSWEQTILIGHSLGGFIAMNVAAILPHKISKLILMDAFYLPIIPYKFFSNYMVNKYEKEPIFHQEQVFSTKAKAVESIMESHPDINLASAEILSTRGCREENGGYVLTRDSAAAKSLLNYGGYIFWKVTSQFLHDKITIPTLFTVTQDSFIFKGYKEMEKANINLAPTSRLVYVKGGHQVHMNDPREIGKLIQSFLERKTLSKL